jgi:glycine/D-amino acid oxidase-like deaminating enzyme/nitrite reductase/ring-hydroxylating ferredoxin subunit
MSKSIWELSTSKPLYEPLQGKKETEIAIVGGGITGLMAAWQLHEAGKRVRLLEARLLGSGTTGHSTAHLTNAIDGKYHRLLADHGAERMRQVVQATRDVQDQLASLDAEEQLESDFQRLPGYYFAHDEQQAERLSKEQEAARRLGLFMEEASLPPSLQFSAVSAVRLNEQAQLNPLKFLYGLARRLTAKGVRLHENSRVEDMKKEEGMQRLYLSNGAELLAEKVIMATHTPIFLDPMHTLIAPYRTYALTLEISRDLHALYWDLDDPYHYIRPYGNQTIILGGADHKTGQADAEHLALERLCAYAAAHFPRARVHHRWSGQIYEPTDGLPYIGESPLRKGMYVATGYSGDGILWGAYAGMLLADLICGRLNPLIDIFSPSRLRLKGGLGDFVRENLNVGKHFLIDRFMADSPEVEAVPKGSGRLIRQGMQQYAVYRAENGELHVLSPTCPHMLCVVKWNDMEKSWDCPCHGSRFSPEGEAIEGPSVHGLTAKKLKKKE